MLTCFSFCVYNRFMCFGRHRPQGVTGRIFMKYRRTGIADVIVFEPQVFSDERGFFAETYRASWFEECRLNPQFVQDNHSLSHYGTLRGLHLQKQQPQGKLVRVARGEVYNVAVDLRLDSATYGQWVGEYLSAANYHVLWIPPGFANGFITTSDTAELLYKCTNYYDAGSELSLLWNSPSLGVQWPMVADMPLKLSPKDRDGAVFVPGMGYRDGQWQACTK